MTWTPTSRFVPKPKTYNTLNRSATEAMGMGHPEPPAVICRSPKDTLVVTEAWEAAESLARLVLEAMGQHLWPCDLTKAVSCSMPGEMAERICAEARKVLDQPTNDEIAKARHGFGANLPDLP